MNEINHTLLFIVLASTPNLEYCSFGSIELKLSKHLCEVANSLEYINRGCYVGEFTFLL